MSDNDFHTPHRPDKEDEEWAVILKKAAGGTCYANANEQIIIAQ